MKLFQKVMTIVMLLSLMMTFLTSCASTPVYVYVKQKIPEELLQCERIKLEGDTYADVIRFAYREKIALIECSERMNAIKAISQEDLNKK